MQPDEGIEHEQTRLQPRDSFLEACAVDLQIEAQLGAVITWMSRLGSATPAAAQMPSRRRRTVCRASSAG